MATLMNHKLSKEEQKLQILENQRLNEITHKLVVKIIIWKSGKLDGTSLTKNDKINKQEWGDYVKHMLNISKIESVERVKNKINETKLAIKLNGGFK